MSHAVIVSPDPLSRSGGVERMCALLEQVLVQAGWQVDVVGAEREAGRWLYRLGGGHLARSRLATAPARKLHPDLLITNGFLGFGAPAGTPRIHVYHGTLVADTLAEGAVSPRRERARRLLGVGLAEALSSRRATVVSVSEAAAREVRRYYRVKTDAVIPNGVDTNVFKPSSRERARELMNLRSDGRFCLFVGRMQYRKGADLLMESCREAGFELLIAGAGGAPGAHNLGILAPDELALAYAATDCVLFPSRYEACSYVVLEAMACGVPLVTTRVGWMSTLLEAVPDYEALCVRPERADIVRRLRELGDIDSAGLAAQARQWVLEHNSLESYAGGWYELLSSLGFHSPIAAVNANP